MFGEISFHQKWNDGRLLLINILSPSCLTSFRTTLDLGSEEIMECQKSV